MNVSYKFLAIFMLLHLSVGKVYQLTAEIVSDSTNWCEGPSNKGSCIPLFLTPPWTAVIPGATWIWETPFVTGPAKNQTVQISKNFYIGGEPTKGTLYIAIDNLGEIWLNSVLVYKLVYNSPRATWLANNQAVLDVTLSLVCGLNKFYAEITNLAGPVEAWDSPGGLLYKLVYSSVYSDTGCGCDCNK